MANKILCLECEKPINIEEEDYVRIAGTGDIHRSCIKESDLEAIL